MAIEVYAALRHTPAEMRKRASGVWALEWTPPANNVPHSVRAAPDGTLFMTSVDFSTGDKLWRKLVGGAWTQVGLGTGGYPKFTGMTVISQDEVWLSARQYVAKWTSGGGFTAWAMAGQLGVSHFFEGLLHAYASNNVIAVGHDNAGAGKYVGYYDGVSWNLEATLATAGVYPTAIHADGNDLWFGIGANSGLWHHPAKGVGAGWSLISAGAGWPAVAAVNGIVGSATDLWVTLSNTTGSVDVARSLNNGSSWTNYTRNAAGNGCTSIHRNGTTGDVFAGHVDRAEVSVFSGAAWTTEATGGGQFGDWLYGTGSYSGHQRLLAQLVTNFTLSGADLTTVPQNGGVLVTLTGVFIAGTSYTVHFGPLGTTSDPVVYAGLIGGGNTQLATASATTIQFVSPPAARGAGYSVTVDDGVLPQTLAGFSVVEQSFYNRTFETRRLWPAWYSTGPRHLKREPRQDS